MYTVESLATSLMETTPHGVDHRGCNFGNDDVTFIQIPKKNNLNAYPYCTLAHSLTD